MSEEQFQKQVAEWLALVLPADCWWTAVNPLPGKRSVVEGARAKAMGLKPGVPDIVICWDGKFYGLELKTTKGRPSKSQVRCFNDIHDAGGYVAVAKSLKEVEAFLRSIGVPIKGVA